jgi:hypothetical protein
MHRLTLRESFIERVMAACSGWRRGYALTPEQRAAWIARSWGSAPAYRVTQLGTRKRLRTFLKARRVYYRLHQQLTENPNESMRCDE